jgi:S-(hydroxymethyl)glutathione dehydrogenase/alcohol dehydrogenase
LDYGQVLVKLTYSGVCRSQLMEISGFRGEDHWLPHLLGHEAVGFVKAVGPGVTKVIPGDEVVLGWLRGDGIDASPAKYSCGKSVVNGGRVTTFSDLSVVSESRVIKVPGCSRLPHMVLLGCALPTGAGMVINQLDVNKGSEVAILGLGGIGMGALIAALSKGFKVVAAMDINPRKLDFAREMGCKHVYQVSSAFEIPRDFADDFPEGVDFCIESAGKVETIELGFSLVNRIRGTLLFASHPPDGETISISPHELISGKKIIGSWGGGVHPDRDFKKLSELIEGSEQILGSLVKNIYELEDINQAVRDLENGLVFRPIIKLGD